jgi:AraC-like DNA-binding protein
LDRQEDDVMWAQATAVSGDSVQIVRSSLMQADDHLRAGAWADAEQILRRALEALGGARQRDTASYARGGLTPNQQRRLVRHVDENLGSSISLPELAAVAGFSSSHFCRTFRSTFGVPPLHFVQQRRAERAMELMLTTDEPLKAIAVDCGLYDQAALCKVFRRVTGESPAAWRRRRRA